jgi:ssDNA-binding Zn-finger/Zn-ribbon topoisomerase 1
MRIQCPSCHSDAVYRYGSISTGKQRFICLICERQFVPEAKNTQFIDKPRCPNCGKIMHSYMKGVKYMRFRCSDYPNCKTYLKARDVAFEIVNADMIAKDLSMASFIKEVEGRPTWKALYLAHDEVTAAERLLLRAKPVSEEKRKKISKYIKELTDFVIFLQSTIKIHRTSKKSNQLFWRYWDSIDKTNRPDR